MAEDFFETPSDSIGIVESEAKDIGLAKSDSVIFADSESEAFVLNLVEHCCCFDDAVSSETHLTGTGTINAGTEDAGTQVNAQVEDGVLWEVGDEVATPGLEVEWALNAGARTPHCIHFVGRYNGHPTNDLNVDIWNYNTTDWDVLGTISRSVQIQSIEFEGITSNHKDGSNDMKVRIQQPAEGRTQDSLFIDHLCVHTTPELNVSVHKPLIASILFADSEVETPEKVLADSQNITEAIAKYIVKPALVDSISFAESISKIAVILGLTDSQTFAESITKSVALGKTDTLSIAEAVAKAVGLYKTDSESIAEAEAWFFNKIITDQITPFADSSILYDVTQEVWWGSIKWRTACHGGI